MIRSRILSVSCNPDLLSAREELLERSGFEVTSVSTTVEALDRLKKNGYSAVLVGNEFSFTEKQLFTADVSERWRVPILVLRSGAEDFEFRGDANIELTAGAATLIAKLKSLVSAECRRSA